MFSSNTSSAAGDANFVEDVFSTYLYPGNGSTQTITNGIDLAGKGGLLWVKCRNVAASHRLYDTGRGANQYLNSASTDGTNLTDTGQSFTSTGFQFASNDGTVNGSGRDYVSWTFREQPKFFDIVAYTGTGSATTIAHNLGSVPGCIIVKRTDTTADWQCYHRSLANTQYLVLNSAAAVDTGATRWNSTTPTSTVFSIGTDTTVNASGGTYVAYIYAHDAGGFGLTGTDNVISCGSFTTDGSGNATVSLGYEPQWVMIKQTNDTGSWFMLDTMRGWSFSDDARLFANLSNSETTFAQGNPTATGFSAVGFSASGTFIYIAIRRGPMKVPTTGTSVYTALAGTYTQPQSLTPGFPIDMGIINKTSGSDHYVVDRLRGQAYLQTASTIAESSSPGSTYMAFDKQNSTVIDNIFGGAYTGVNWFFRRAPGFFDEVCFPTAGSRETNLRVTHNLAVVPELIIVKDRTAAANWTVYSGSINQLIILNSTTAIQTVTNAWGTSAPTSSNFGLDTINFVNSYGDNMVAYLFATCPGVSKVGSFTGTGTTLQINCGFTGGARFVLIKRTDSTGDWYVWDTARGIVAGNDPYLLLNSTAAEVTSTDYVDTFSSGFEISSTAPAAINASGGTFIFLAIA